MADALNTLSGSIDASKQELLRIAQAGGAAAPAPTDENRSLTGPERLKSLSSSALETGGKLLPAQKAAYEKYIYGSSDIMEHADINMVSDPEGRIDNIYISSSVTKAYTESSTATETATPVLGKDQYNTVELFAAIDVEHKTLTRNIMRDDFGDYVVNMVLEAMGYDIANAVVNGEGVGSSDPLLVAFEGLEKMSDRGHVLSAGGAEIGMDIFSGALARFPNQKKRFLRKKLNWMAHSQLWQNWDDSLYSRVSNLGDSAFGGNAPTPYGIPRLAVDEMKTEMDVTYSSATPATIKCTKRGLYIITTSDNKITLDVNNGGAHAYSVPAGAYRAVELAYAINTLLLADSEPEICHVDPDGKLYFETPTTGAAAEIEIVAVAGDMYTVIGTAAAVVPGKVAGANTRPIGTYMLLTDPKNLWVGVLDSLRVFWQHIPRKNRWELTVYTELIPVLRDPDAVVKVEDIKLKEYM